MAIPSPQCHGWTFEPGYRQERTDASDWLPVKFLRLNNGRLPEPAVHRSFRRRFAAPPQQPFTGARASAPGRVRPTARTTFRDSTRRPVDPFAKEERPLNALSGLLPKPRPRTSGRLRGLGTGPHHLDGAHRRHGRCRRRTGCGRCTAGVDGWRRPDVAAWSEVAPVGVFRCRVRAGPERTRRGPSLTGASGTEPHLQHRQQRIAVRRGLQPSRQAATPCCRSEADRQRRRLPHVPCVHLRFRHARGPIEQGNRCAGS